MSEPFTAGLFTGGFLGFIVGVVTGAAGVIVVASCAFSSYHSRGEEGEAQADYGAAIATLIMIIVVVVGLWRASGW